MSDDADALDEADLAFLHGDPDDALDDFLAEVERGTALDDAELEAEYIAESGTLEYEDVPMALQPLETAEGLNITGGEGFGTVRRRNLLVLQELPVYLKVAGHPEAGIDRALQLQTLEPDIREAMAKAARKLHDTAMKYSVTGYDWDLEDIQYDIQNRTVIATLVIERE